MKLTPTSVSLSGRGEDVLLLVFHVIRVTQGLSKHVCHSPSAIFLNILTLTISSNQEGNLTHVEFTYQIFKCMGAVNLGPEV